MAGMMNAPDNNEPVARKRGCWRLSWRAALYFWFAIALLFWGGYLFVKHQWATVNRVEAINFARQISEELVAFDENYGSFPSSATSEAVKLKTAWPWQFGDGSSNQLFCQLIANGCKSERVFFAAINGTHKVDDVWKPEGAALKPGECGFSYIAGLSSKSPPEAPLVVTPLIPGTTRFDPRPFNGRALILRVDKSISCPKIDRSGRVMVGGKDLFDPAQPFWGGKAPDIKWHEPRSRDIR